MPRPAHRRAALVALVWTSLGGTAVATPDDSAGVARVFAVDARHRLAVIGQRHEDPGAWSEIAVWTLPAGGKARVLSTHHDGPHTPAQWAAWANEAIGEPVALLAPRTGRVSPDRAHVVTMRQYVHPTEAYVVVTVELVSALGRRTLIRRRVARGCDHAWWPSRPLDAEAIWVGNRTVIIAGSILARCTNFNDNVPLLEIVAVDRARHRLSSRRLFALLQREARRLTEGGRPSVTRPEAIAAEAAALCPRCAASTDATTPGLEDPGPSNGDEPDPSRDAG